MARNQIGPTLKGTRRLKSLSLGHKLALGPHAQLLFDEMLHAADAQLYASTIILAATIVDVALHESEEGEDGLGLAYLTAPERKALDWLRGRRNGLVHYKGVVSGMGKSAKDVTAIADDAERALQSVIPLMETLENYG